MSVVVVATLFPLAGRRDEVVAAIAEAIPRVHAEDGCELYALHEGDDRLVMVEKWATQEALDTHLTGPVLAELGRHLDGALARPTEIQMLRPHPAGTPEQGAL
ncbi:MAG: antibiotic biosynthesis monooxygenase [Micromonosporaceae bacterium]|jgi:quinol monooxygenase YgiN|nr:antibiotic biosynthesis monooxygenase [Micromonosporaceae bacterium]